jgi:hypothetical protein
MYEKHLILKNTQDLELLESLAKEYGQEATIDSNERFVSGRIVYWFDVLKGGGGIFKYSDGLVIDYLSPSITKKSFELVEQLIMKIKTDIEQLNIDLPVTILRDKSESFFFESICSFEIRTFKDLPYSYRKRSEYLCSNCNKLNTECIPTVFKLI